MAQPAITIKGFDRLATGLVLLGKMEDVKTVITSAAEHVESKIKKYPPRANVHMTGFVSDKQRRWFFAALRSGAIEVPYRRGQSPGSKDLGQQWNVKTTAKGFGAIIGNNVSYGIYVQHPQHQSAMMELIGWKTTDKVVEEEKNTVIEMILDGLDIALERC